MPYDERIAKRLRALLAGTPGLSEKKLFGGLGFFVHGKLAVSAYKDGGILVRCSRESWQALCREAGARPMTQRGKPVSGWVLVGDETVADEETLRAWVGRGREFAAAQPRQ